MAELTDAQQRVVVSLIRERNVVVEIADKQVAEINKALQAAASAFAAVAGLDGDWAFAQEIPGGPIGLNEKKADESLA